jgi:hypothetical protein
MPMIRIQAVKWLRDHVVELEFTDGSSKTVDLEPFLQGAVFQPLRHNHILFRSVRVEPELKTIVWDNGADICPDVLFDAPAA